MPDTSTPEPLDDDLDVKPTTYRTFLDSTQDDPELRAIEATLVILQALPYDTQVRAVTYIRTRIESDPAVWATNPGAARASRDDVAQTLAGLDGYDWTAMGSTAQARYYHRADALVSGGLTVVRNAQ